MINQTRRRQLLEEEIDKLRREIAVAGYVQRRLFWQEEESISTYFLYLFQDSFFLFIEDYTVLGDWRGWGSWTEKPFFWDGHANYGYVFVYRYTKTHTK